MEFDVDWTGLACCVVGGLVGCYFSRKSEALLHHYRSAELFDPEDKHKNADQQLVFVNLGTVKDTEGSMEVNNHGFKTKVVAKVLIEKENRVVFNPAVRLWYSSPSVKTRLHSWMPFSLQTDGGQRVVISSAEVARMDHVLSTISTKIQPVEDQTFLNNVLDYVSGEITKSYETTVKGLIVGSRVSAIGWVSSQQSRNLKSLGLTSKTKWFLGDEPSGRGFKLILSTRSMQELIAQEKTRAFYIKLIVFGFVVGAGIFVGRKSWKSVQDFFGRRRFAAVLQNFMEQRRGQSQDRTGITATGAGAGASMDEEEVERTRTCIICLENTRQTLFVPCAHVCACSLCADAMMRLPGEHRCPVCRNIVTSVSTIRFP